MVPPAPNGNGERKGRPARVLIAGGGITAMEAALALRRLGGDRVEVRVLAPNDALEVVPLSVVEPFGEDVPVRHQLTDLAERAGAELVPGALARVDAEHRVAVTADGRELGYDRLIVAVGALRMPYMNHSTITFSGHADVMEARRLLERIRAGAERGVSTRLAVVVPPGAGWHLPGYELALLAAYDFEARGLRELVQIALVTAEDRPLAAFGEEASAEVSGDLRRAGIMVHAGAVVLDWTMGRLHLIPSGEVPVDQVMALPMLRGPAIEGLPCDGLGFVYADGLCRVGGHGDVFVVGDAGTSPLKGGGVGCRQAGAVAALIAREAGADVPEPSGEALLENVLLLGGGARRILRSHPTRAGEASLGASWIEPSGPIEHKLAARDLWSALAVGSGAGLLEASP
jgi:sulfide:quinone oxidoreductase